MEVKVIVTKAFTKDPTKGSAAGIVLGSDLSEQQMQQVAAQMGFPATAFVQEYHGGYRVRFFSTIKESPLCVHAGLASVFYATKEKGQEGNPVTLETKAGRFTTTTYQDGLTVMEMATPTYSDFIADNKEIAKILGINETDIGEYAPQIVSVGKPKLIVPIRSLNTLLRINPDIDKMRAYCISSGAQGLFMFAPNPRDPNAAYYARHFNPLTLAQEDPVCGIGSADLGAYLQQREIAKGRFSVQMGQTCSTNGYVIVEVGERIKVGGYTAIVEERVVKIE